MGAVRHAGDMEAKPADQRGQGILTPQAGTYSAMLSKTPLCSASSTLHCCKL